MEIEFCIAVTFFVTGAVSLFNALLVDNIKTAKCVAACGVGMVYVGAMMMIWGGM